MIDFTNITNIEVWNKEIPTKYIKRMIKMNKKIDDIIISSK